MNSCSVVVCLLVAACGKSEKAPAPKLLDAQPADAAVVVVDAAAKLPDPTTAKILEVVIADRVGCARRSDGRVRCWGSPWDGRGLPVVASPVELAGLTTAVAIDLGADQTLYVVTEDGGVRRGTLDLRGTTELASLDGIEDVVDVRAYLSVPVVLMRNGNVFTPASASPILTNAVALKRAANGSIQVLHRDGRVSWFNGKVHSVAKLDDATALFGDRCAERRSGARVCWDSGRLKPWAGATNIVDRVAGPRVRCDLTSSGVACSGKILDVPGKPIAIAAGSRSACAVLDRGEVACWGANDGGQLGDGTLVDREKPIVVPGLTTSSPVAPSDGRAKVQEAATAMDWTGLPAGCKRPTALAALDSVASAYATISKAGATVWLADFALEPAGYPPPLPPVRGMQRALEIVLGNGRKPVDRGRYGAGKPRTAKLTIHAAERTPETVGSVDLVVELVDKAWICGQLLGATGFAQRQPFAARVSRPSPK
jgi:hypothetical protein